VIRKSTLNETTTPPIPHAKWPNSVHDPELATAWKSNVKRLLNIERLASDAADGRINVGIEPGATAVFEKFTTRMIALASAINLPESQRGIIRKMMHHAARLALIHRCLRWSSGEFSASGPLGKIDEQDAEAGAEAAMVFLGRWIIWRPELAENLNAPTHVFGLERDPGNDPALQVLAAMAAASHVGIGRIEQLIRYLRRLSRPVRLAELSTRGPLATLDEPEIHSICVWLVNQGQAEWQEGEEVILLKSIARPQAAGKRSATTEAAAP